MRQSVLWMFRWTVRMSVISALLTLLSGCASLPGGRTISVGEREVEYRLTPRTQGPVVILENGLGGTFDWWAKVVPQLEAQTQARLLTYNRAGYGRSSMGYNDDLRDGEHIVQELHDLLHTLQLQPPYVLVGHSLGGLYMQWFARRYPNEVHALVLVDSTHPAQMQAEGAPERWPTWLRWTFNAITNTTAKAELQTINATGDSLLQMPTYTGPVEVLSALQPMQDHSTPFTAYANKLRADMVKLYPNARQVWVNSGHVIPLEAPEAIVSAVMRVMPAQTPHALAKIESKPAP